MNYKKATLDINLFDVEDIITTSSASGNPTGLEGENANANGEAPNTGPSHAPEPTTPDVPFYEEDEV